MPVALAGFLRVATLVLSGVGLADIAKDWFRPKDQRAGAGVIVRRGWIGWIIAAVMAALLLKYTGVIKKR